ncbi:MAG: GNAT family N-acetyltransferase [Eubacteriales bacterium]|nr:GNAT family N-acetyltransferase [Eubacteriales bacterium]
MPRKPVLEGGKREEIVTAALELFFMQGYDGTSVRSIMNKAGGEVGLFYYYFKNKDDVFDSVLDRFFARYNADFAQIVAHGRRNPCRVMQDFFEYMERETAEFRQKYADNMHRTVRWAIREHTLTLIEPYLEQIVAIQSAYYGVQPVLAPTVAAMYLTHGVGSYILHEDQERLRLYHTEVKRGTSLIMGMPPEEQELRTPYPATAADLPGWMALVRATRDFFPGLEESDYERQLAARLARGEGWVFRYDGKIAAALLSSTERGELDFLAVSPEYRRHGLGARLVETAAAALPVGTELSVVTYREGDSKGAAARSFYAALGFQPAEELMVFDYPCQRLWVAVPDGPLIRHSPSATPSQPNH